MFFPREGSAEEGRCTMDKQEDIFPSSQDRDILEILLESDLYLELPLKERHELFKHILTAYFFSSGRRGTC